MAYARLLDSAAGFLTGDHLTASGQDGASLWTSQARPGSGLAKPATASQVDTFRAHGKKMFSNFQFGKPKAPFVSDFRRGIEGGREDARNSLAIHRALGGPEKAPHYFSVDEDISLRDWNALAAPWFRGIGEVLGGRSMVGIYGSRRALEYAQEDGVCDFYWQARGWRYEGYLDWAHIHQTAIDIRIPGVPFSVDTNEAIQEKWGGWHEYESAGLFDNFSDSEFAEFMTGIRQLSRAWPIAKGE
jgi:hypothetical protein